MQNAGDDREPDETTTWRRPRNRHAVVLHPRLSLALAIVFTLISIAMVWVVILLVTGGAEPSGRVGSGRAAWPLLMVLASPLIAAYFWISALRDGRAWQDRREREAADPNSATRRPWWVA